MAISSSITRHQFSIRRNSNSLMSMGWTPPSFLCNANAIQDRIKADIVAGELECREVEHLLFACGAYSACISDVGKWPVAHTWGWSALELSKCAV
jgi:hypothetical protein